jgi:hypothetical protein
VADQDTNWTWNFSGPSTMSKAQSRAVLPKEIAWDLIGFDGNETGALRTHPGFKALTGDGGSFQPATMANVRGFWPVTVLTSANTYLWGYVWAEYTLVSGNHTITFYAKLHDGSSWIEPNVTGDRTITTITGVSDTTEIDVECSGRFMYFFVRGGTPKLASFAIVSSKWSVSNTSPFAAVVTLGPGDPPTATNTASTIQTINGTTANRFDFCVFGENANGVDTGGTAGTYASGNYTFAVQFMSTVTGRKSAISNTTTFNVTGSSVQHLKFRVGQFRTGYNRALIYRTVNLGTGTGGSNLYGSGTLHLERVVDITDSNNYSDATTNKKLGVTLTDTQLVYQDVYIDKTRADKTGPKGGVAQFLANMLFVSRINDSSPDTSLPTTTTSITPEYPPRSLGDMRWSSLTELTAENFPPSNRWVPQTPANEIIGMRQVGNYMMGFSTDRIYRMGRQGSMVRVEEGHMGYGLVGPYALETVGTTVYFLSGTGLKAVSMDGTIEDVTALDNLVNVTWASAKSTVQMAYDAKGQCMTVMKPDTGAAASDGYAAILWFGTNRITQLIDLPFRYAKTGNVQVGSYLERRALFVKRNSTTTFGVYIVDHERSNANKNLCGGPTSTSGRNLQVTGAAPTIDVTEFDCKAYQYTTNAGAAESISTGNGAVQTYISGWTPAANTYVSFAPIVQRWVGGNLGMQFQPGMPEFKDFFRQKQVSSVAPYYEIVQGTPPAHGTWWGLLYQGAEESVYISSRPLDRDGVPQTIGNGTKVYAANAPFRTHGAVWSSLSPGFQCHISGIDMRLLAFSVTGRILDTDRRFN